MKNLFTEKDTQETLKRIDSLAENSKPNWGKMSVGQMLSHCSVTYEMVFTDKHKKPNLFLKHLLKKQ